MFPVAPGCWLKLENGTERRFGQQQKFSTEAHTPKFQNLREYEHGLFLQDSQIEMLDYNSVASRGAISPICYTMI